MTSQKASQTWQFARDDRVILRTRGRVGSCGVGRQQEGRFPTDPRCGGGRQPTVDLRRAGGRLQEKERVTWSGGRRRDGTFPVNSLGPIARLAESMRFAHHPSGERQNVGAEYHCRGLSQSAASSARLDAAKRLDMVIVPGTSMCNGWPGPGFIGRSSPSRRRGRRPLTLVAPTVTYKDAAADKVVSYESNRYSTLRNDQRELFPRPCGPRWPAGRRRNAWGSSFRPSAHTWRIGARQNWSTSSRHSIGFGDVRTPTSWPGCV